MCACVLVFSFVNQSWPNLAESSQINPIRRCQVLLLRAMMTTMLLVVPVRRLPILTLHPSQKCVCQNVNVRNKLKVPYPVC